MTIYPFSLAPRPAAGPGPAPTGPGRGLRLALAFGLFAAGLPWAGYGPQHLRYDAGEYWELATTFFVHKQFGLLHYHSAERGYAGPLLLLPAYALARLTGWMALTCTGLWGAGWAALLFGAVLPAGWRQASGRALGGAAWAALLALGWLFWRGYFLFPLLDGAALALFGAGLLLLGQRRALAWGAAGLALALALNLRPSYLVSLPVVGLGLGLLALRRPGHAPGGAGRCFWGHRAAAGARPASSASPRQLVPGAGPRAALLGAFALGAALALAPQWAINRHWFGRATPLVLFRDPHDARPIYLRALGWGTRVERYETGFFADAAGPPRRTLLVPDAAGIRHLHPYGPRGFASYGQYAGFVARHPLAVAGRYGRHLAHTFDLWYATPYPLARHWPGQGLFRGLNYVLLALGLRGLWRLPRRGPGAARGRWLLLALALPVLLTVPFHVETRYGMPLHLVLLLAAVGSQPWAGPWPRRRVAQWALLGALWLGGWAMEAQRQEALAVYDPPGLET